MFKKFANTNNSIIFVRAIKMKTLFNLILAKKRKNHMIIAHRGYWLDDKEKNTKIAFERSFSLGFGTETDIRDFNGDLVISHDFPTKDSITVDMFFQIFNSFDKTLPLALNIKSDGLQALLLKLLKKYNIENYYVFDMSVPDALGYLNKGINIYTRESEYEKTPSFYSKAKGVWLDEFLNNWITKEKIQNHIDNNKSICIVSPELHKRDYTNEWKKYRDYFDVTNNLKVNICTDKPVEAKSFFKWEK